MLRKSSASAKVCTHGGLQRTGAHYRRRFKILSIPAWNRRREEFHHIVCQPSYSDVFLDKPLTRPIYKDAVQIRSLLSVFWGFLSHEGHESTCLAEYFPVRGCRDPRANGK